MTHYMCIEDIKDSIVSPEASILEAINSLSTSELQIVNVVNHEGRLLGVLTDGDIRRALLAGLDMESPCLDISSRVWVAVEGEVSVAEVKALMLDRKVREIPVLNKSGRLIGLFQWYQVFEGSSSASDIVIVAGGLGTRMLSLTENTPKPMLHVGGKPMLEKILLCACELDPRRVFISVGYKSQVIMDYFGDGSKWGVKIEYLVENKRLGTAGFLKLLPADVTDNIIVVNGDIISTLSFDALLQNHEKSYAEFTVGVRVHDYQNPFGVLDIKGDCIVGLEEKPIQKSFVSAGVYCIKKSILSMLGTDDYIDMPDFINKILTSHPGKVKPFYIHESWKDFASPEDLQEEGWLYD